MKGEFLLGSNDSLIEPNIYADKSSLILEWLFTIGIHRTHFSIREIARERNVSVGLVQRVFKSLILVGCLQVVGLRTAKIFSFKNPKVLLESWLNHYSIIKKCKMRTYRTGFQTAGKLIETLKKSKLQQKVALALHSAAEAHGYKNTNLQTLELYLLDPKTLPALEEVLQLEPQEKGYEVLLIDPYYKSILNCELYSDKQLSVKEGLPCSPILLTFLDLAHFPL